MLSCDGVRPIVVELVQFIPKGSRKPHAKAPANPETQGDQPENWRAPSGRGHHIPAPLWEGCRATIQTLLSCSAVPAGGCRSSGWALVLLAVAGVSRWPVGFWLFRFPFRGRRPEARSEGVAIKEGMQASQSALLLGPEHLLRWGCHSMSSCDGVRPSIV